MSDERHVIVPAGERRDGVIDSLSVLLRSLDGKLQVTIKRWKPKRSNQQNAYLWGAVYPTILHEAGLANQGWDADDLHEFFLIDAFGSEVIEGFGRKRQKPLRRSSGLSTTEFMDYIDHIQRFMAEKGVDIPSPNEAVT